MQLKAKCNVIFKNATAPCLFWLLLKPPLREIPSRKSVSGCYTKFRNHFGIFFLTELLQFTFIFRLSAVNDPWGNSTESLWSGLWTFPKAYYLLSQIYLDTLGSFTCLSNRSIPNLLNFTWCSGQAEVDQHLLWKQLNINFSLDVKVVSLLY